MFSDLKNIITHKSAVTILIFLLQLSFLRAQFVCGDTLTDSRDGQKYPTIQIGDQCWMEKNLNIGTMITSYAPGDDQSDNDTIEKYCYGNYPAACNIYGGLYQWYELMEYGPSDDDSVGTTQGICPEGWHIPTDNEWLTLVEYVGGYNIAGGELKEAGTINWNAPNTGATNSTGFTGLPGGFRHWCDGTFTNLGHNGLFWSATGISGTQAIQYYLMYSWEGIERLPDGKTRGFSLRCLCDNFIGINHIYNSDGYLFDIYPNPVKNDLNIRYRLPAGTDNGFFIISDIYGKIIVKTRLIASLQPLKIPVAGLAPGTYFCYIKTQEFISTIKKIIIIR